MAKRKSMVHREPNGRPSRAAMDPGPSPASLRRLQDAALAGMADARWGTQIGRLSLSGKISAEMFAAAGRWTERAAKYRQAIESPAVDPKAIDLDRCGGSGPDPDSEEGIREAKRHEKAVAAFIDAYAALKCAGGFAEQAVRRACEHDIAPVGESELKALCTGLSALSAYWHLTPVRKSQHVR